MKLELKGDSLGARHKCLNNFSESIAPDIDLKNVNTSNSDIENLVKIDLASKNRNVDYILCILRCNDMLYVSRAIKQCPWLITESAYEHIINPRYLHEVLYPEMITKAVHKHIKYIKLNLKDPRRAEQFYLYETDPKKAVEWLPHTTTGFIVSNFKKHIEHVDITLLKRLCEKTITVLEIYMDNCDEFYLKREAMQALMFLIKHDLQRYLDIVEKNEFLNLQINKKSTEYIVKHDFSRIKNKFLMYCNAIDVPTFLKYLKKEQSVKSFLCALFEQNESSLLLHNNQRCLTYETLTQFLKAMPKADSLETVKQVIIHKKQSKDNRRLPKPLKDSNLINYIAATKRHVYYHFWYRFTPFEFALSEIKKNIDKQTPTKKINSIFETLLVAAAHNTENLITVIKYFCENFAKANHEMKKLFLENLFKFKKLHEFDEDTNNIIRKTFMDDYITAADGANTDERYVQMCIESIIITETIQMRVVSDAIHNRFIFNSLKSYETTLKIGDKDKVFIYLYNTIMKKLNHHSSSSKEELMEKIKLLEHALDLLSDWNKNLCDYPPVINAIRDLVKTNELNSWNISFSEIYNKKKSWRKVLFDDSLTMSPSEPVLLNILKHNPALLEKSNNLEKELFKKDKFYLRTYFSKVKLYWPESLCQELIQMCNDQLKKGVCNKTIIRALCTLLPADDFKGMLIKYTPENETINWDSIHDVFLNVQQYLSKYMHLARPQPDPEIIIKYARGDYLLYALPSLYSIFYNLNVSRSQQCIPMLMDTKVSIQKHAIRLAFMKLHPEQIKNLLGDVIKSNKNPTIRYVSFKLTYKLLCKEKDPKKIQSFWPIMETFLDDLTYKDNVAIYDLLFEVRQLPVSIRGKYFMKAYPFLKGLIASSPEFERYNYSFEQFISYAREIMEHLCPVFVENIVLDYLANEFSSTNKEHQHKMELLSYFILNSDTKEAQVNKYEKILLPLLQKCFKHWNDVDESKNYLFRVKLNNFLNCLMNDTKTLYVSQNKDSPIELFNTIEKELLKSLEISSSYLIITTWQLAVTFISKFNSCKRDGHDWDISCSKVIPAFSNKCQELLIEHTKTYFSNVYVLFAKALDTCLRTFFSRNNILEVLTNLVPQEDQSMQVNLVVLHLLMRWYSENSDEVEKVKKILSVIGRHLSPEVQVHYYQCCIENK
ncbi:unnamed protein product [Leptosia nina]|uniref:Uncharacterized protein n=1 Tax=Leptosia nina TaxID=320188 RepID=A0AAV1IZ15_9NEOP